jgi:Zn ribbon nucleic-acid-binding protein
MSCPLCKAEKLTWWYYEDSLCWIADCKTCGVPLAVLKRHTTQPTPEEVEHMVQIAKKLFPGKRIDFTMKSILGHFHFHTR